MSTSLSSPSGVDVDTGRLDGASRLRVFTVLAVIVLYTEIAPLQFTMVGAALQKMAKSFPTVGANINWAVIILGLIGASATPLLGKASDIWGKKKLFLLCGVLFLIGCVIDALTDNWTLFLIGRGLQALAIASQFISYGLIRDLLPRKYIPLSLGIVGAGLGFSGVIAPFISGVLIDHFDWQAMFWFLAAFTLVLTPLVIAIVPESPLRVKQRIDPFGAVMLSGGALLILLYLDNGQTWGWTRVSALAYVIAGVLLLAGFFVVELRVAQPIMDMKLLLNPKVSVVLLMTFFGVGLTAVQPVALGYMSQTPDQDHLRDSVVDGVVTQTHQMTGQNLPASLVKVAFDPGYTYGNGFSMVQYAVHLGIWAGVMGMIVGPLAGALTRRIGARTPAIIGLALLAIAALGYTVASYSWPVYLLISAIGGIAFGFIYAAVPNLIVEAVPAEQQGISTGMLGVVQNIGTSAAVAVMTAMLNANPVKAQLDVAGHRSEQVIPQVFADHGYHTSFVFVLITTIIGLVIALFMRHGRTPTTGGVAGDTLIADAGAGAGDGIVAVGDTPAETAPPAAGGRA
ncbi:MFS transporter [Nocardia aurantia]|uniref:Multidrug resistance protein MdtL n=1 Tax=Nocardia aurantia TaxID=2585199 RepID=A0A7K0DR87_9NOCA|nr:MFS transporter [Nocardia aurantia]MQY27882.1 Multidrug resistance protein MdtL [Nocardia aurantia]